MKKQLYIGSNFKMYKNIRATEEYLQAISAATRDIDREKVQFFFIPSYTSLKAQAKPASAANLCWARRICAGNLRDSLPEKFLLNVKRTGR